MPRYIIVFNNGYGPVPEVVEAENEEAAKMMAYEAAREDWENNADYWTEEANEDNLANYNLEDE